jgi:hypothetical protein
MGNTQPLTILLTLLMAGGILSFLYLAVIHRSAARQRSRIRRGEAQLVAARIFPPHGEINSLGEEVALTIRRLRGIVDDQPRALPLLAAIFAGGLLMIPALDLIVDDPILFDLGLSLPGWLKGIWMSGVLLLVLGHAVWIFLNAPKYLSRQWLLLHPDGRIASRGAALPHFDPAMPLQHFEGISMPDPDPEILPRWAEGAVLVQGETVAGFVYFPFRRGLGELRTLTITPKSWWRIELGPDHVRFDKFLKKHYPPGIRAVGPGWPLPTTVPHAD